MRFKRQLVFDEPNETLFKDYYCVSLVTFMRLSIALGILLFIIHGFFDANNYPESVHIISALRYYVIVPLLLIIFILTFFKIFSKYNQLFLMLVGFIAGIGVLSMMYVLNKEELTGEMHSYGFLLVLTWIYVLIRLRFYYSLIVSFSLTFMYIALLTYRLNTDCRDNETELYFYNMLLFLFGVNIAGVLTSYSIEYYVRKNFMHRQIVCNENEIIKQQSEKIEVHKAELEKKNVELKEMSIVAEKTNNAISVYNAEGKLVWINEGCVKLFGYNYEETLKYKGKTIYEISGNPKMKQLIMESIDATEPIVFITNPTTKSGKKIWIRTTLTTIFDNGKLEKIIAFDSDITLYKQASEQLREQRDELEKAFKKNSKQQVKITIALDKIKTQNDELEKAYRKVQETSKLKEIFLANTSHEIRTPLNAILGFTNLLISNPNHERKLDYLKYIKTSGNNLMVILNDILDFSKIEAGKLSFEAIPFDLHAFINNVKNTMQVKAKEKKIDFIITICQNIPKYIVGDPTRLNQIMINLIGNAIKFTAINGVVKLRVLLENIDAKKNKCTIKFVVEDSGIGIPKEKQETIFETFTQAEGDTTRKFGGTGLGLSISKKLVEMQKGTITVDSEVGKGTAFNVVLSFDITDKNKVLSDTDDDVYLGSCHIKELNLLLVEDNPLNQQLAIDTIEAWNSDINIDVADNGKIAIEMLEKNAYHLILMDMQMPIMNGEKATEIIRNEFAPPKSNTPIIAMTAHAMSQEKQNCIEIGMNDYISKPFNQYDLFSKIKKYTCYKIQNLVKENKPYMADEYVCDAINEAKNSNQEQHSKSAFKAPISKGIIDLSYLNKLYAKRPDKKNKMLQMYIDTIPLEISELEKYLLEKNYAKVSVYAHTIKPKMTYIGLKEAFELCKEVEAMAKTEMQNYDMIFSKVQQISSFWKQAKQEIKNVLDNN